MNNLKLITVILLVLFAQSCKKESTKPVTTPEEKVAVDNPANPDDIFGVYHNKGIDYIKSHYTLTGDYTFAEGQEQIIQLVRKWADEMVNDAGFITYCGGDKQAIQQDIYIATDSMSRRPELYSEQPIIEKYVKQEMVSNVPQDEGDKMGPFIDLSLDKLDSFVKKLVTDVNYYKGIKAIEKDYMAISQNATGRRYFSLFRYSAYWMENNMGKESHELKWRVIVADIMGAGEKWMEGSNATDVVLGAIVASASAALNRGKI